MSMDNEIVPEKYAHLKYVTYTKVRKEPGTVKKQVNIKDFSF